MYGASPFSSQLDLFGSSSLNPTYEIKRSMRIAARDAGRNRGLSRDQLVDHLNDLASEEGLKASLTKPIFENWLKDSAPERLPSLPWLVLFCKATGSVGPVLAMALPLGAAVIGEDRARTLAWAEAELERRRAAKRARIALEGLTTEAQRTRRF